MDYRDLEVILDLDMTCEEAEAYKLMLFYDECSRKAFPDYTGKYRHKRLIGDPRKKQLFKYCWKIIHLPELVPAESILYIRAQFEIIKALSKDKNADNDIFYLQPNCLVGPKAWNRWLKWKHIWKKVKQEKVLAAPESTHVDLSKIQEQLTESKEFMESKLDNLDCATIQGIVENRTMLRWISTKRVSPYYPILSPIFQKWLTNIGKDLDSLFYIDFTQYQSHINDQVLEYFKSEFSFEF